MSLITMMSTPGMRSFSSSPCGISRIRPLLAMMTVLANAQGCGEPIVPEILTPLETDTDGNVSGTGAYDGEGVDETGTPYYNGCLRFPDPPWTAIQHQCNGVVTLNLSFTIEGATEEVDGPVGPIPHLLPFGEAQDDDSYTKPKVMACCYPIENAEASWNEPHINSCYHDFVETGCASTVNRLLELRDAEETPLLARPQIEELAQWLADNQDLCYQSLWEESGASVFFPGQLGISTLPEPFPDFTWTLPEDAETANVKNIQIELITPWITGVHLPSNEEDWIECNSQQDNTTQFIEAGPASGITLELTEGGVSLAGPSDPLLGPPVGASGLASTDNDCGDTCSYFSFTPISRSLDALVLDSFEPVDVGWSNEYVTFSEFRIALYAPVEAPAVGTNHYVVPANAARFSVTGYANGRAWSLFTTNADAINVEYKSILQQWMVSEFDLEYVDVYNELWVLTIDDLQFKE